MSPWRESFLGVQSRNITTRLNDTGTVETDNVFVSRTITEDSDLKMVEHGTFRPNNLPNFPEGMKDNLVPSRQS